MTLYSYKAPYTSNAILAFHGNPNVTITAISTSGGITTSRTSGKTPCFIQASASAITATGTSRPYEDLSYTWDFGDSSSVETVTNNGVGGGTILTNSGQKGPEALHCYRLAGTYTITLTIAGKNGSGYTITTVTQEIVVSAMPTTDEAWADENAVGSSNAGTLANPFDNIAAINTFLASGNDKWLHIKDDSNFAGATGIDLWASGDTGGSAGLRIDRYGSGAKPIIDITSGADFPIFLSNGSAGTGRPKTDIVISGLRCIVSGTSTSGAQFKMQGGHASAAISHVWLDNCEGYTNHTNGDCNGITQASDTHSHIGIYKCDMTELTQDTRDNMGMFCESHDWLAIFGCSVQGNAKSTDTGLCHHIYPSFQYHALVAYNTFAPGGTYRGYCINANSDGDGLSLIKAQYNYIAYNDCTGAKRSIDLSNGNVQGEGPNNSATTQFEYIVCQGNRHHGLTSNGAYLFACATLLTVRHEEAWNLGGEWFSPNAIQLGALLQAQIYGNKIHYASDAASCDPLGFTDNGWLLFQQITDNIIHDDRATARVMCVSWSQQTGATIDRNQYYLPNDAGANGWRDRTTEKTFAQWQANGFDLNGSVADPGWTDPANGDFS